MRRTLLLVRSFYFVFLRQLVDEAAGIDVFDQRHVAVTLGIFFQNLGIFLGNFLDRQLEILFRWIRPGRKIVLAEIFLEDFAVLDLHILGQDLEAEFFISSWPR